MQQPEHAHFRDVENVSLRLHSANQILLPTIPNSSPRTHCANLVFLHPMVMANLVRQVLKTSTMQSRQDDVFVQRQELHGRRHRSTCHQYFDAQEGHSQELKRCLGTRRRLWCTQHCASSTRQSWSPSAQHIRLHAEHRLDATHQVRPLP